MINLKKKLREKLRVSPLTILEYYEVRRKHKEIPYHKHPVLSIQSIKKFPKDEIERIVAWFDSEFPMDNLEAILSVVDIKNKDVINKINSWKLLKMQKNSPLSSTNIRAVSPSWTIKGSVNITCKHCGKTGSSSDGSINEFVKNSNVASGFLPVCNSCNTLMQHYKGQKFSIVGPYSLLKDYKRCTECHKVVHKTRVVSEFRLHRSSGNIVEPISFFSPICKDCEFNIKKAKIKSVKSYIKINT